MVIKEDVKRKLKFLGLDLENLPKSITNVKPLSFTVSRLRDDRDLKVYKYIPVDEIDILLTPHNKGEDLKLKYSDAIPLFKYLDPSTEDTEDYARYLEFINMFKYYNQSLIDGVVEEQERFSKKIPFEIRYPRSHMWDIYYDEISKRYFMLVCTKEGDFTEFFYLLKKKIELESIRNREKEGNSNNIDENMERVKTTENINESVKNIEKIDEILKEYFSDEEQDLELEKSKEVISEETGDEVKVQEDLKKNNDNLSIDFKIYAPINYIPMSEKFISSNELLEIENYLWYFTKKWPITFDLYDAKNNYSLVIKGETNVFDRIESDYRFVLKDKEEAIRLYKHLKALFILESSTDNYFNFKAEIKQNFELVLRYENSIVDFDAIPDLIFKKYNELYTEIEVLNEENKSKTVKLNILKDDLAKKEDSYKQKQAEVVQYLECKKSFTKRVKYYFKRSDRISKVSNRSQIKEEVRKKLEADRKEVEVDYTVIDTLKSLEKKEFYTIDDFTFIYSLFEKLKRKVTGLTLDIRGLKLALFNINNKLSNVETYLEEIDEHKRSIFEFWKFANKDNKLSLEEAGIEEESSDFKEPEVKRERVFNFDMDIEAVAEHMDEIQRKKFSKQELNALYLLDDGFNEYINMMKTKDIDEYAMVSFLDDLKREYKDESKYIGEVFDVFGSSQPSIKTRYLKTNEFRELDREKYKILSLNPSIDKFKFIEKLNENLNYIEEAIHKVKTTIQMPVYKALPSIERITHNKLELFNIDVEDELKNYKGVGNTINLIKINIPKDSNAVFYTNIIYYENQNKTLPLGMDVNKKILLDLSQYKLEEVLREKIVVNKYFNNINENKIFKNINLIEYDIIKNITKD